MGMLPLKVLGKDLIQACLLALAAEAFLDLYMHHSDPPLHVAFL